MHTWHYVPRARKGTLLARDHRELIELWRRFTAAFPNLLALCIMPDHVHLLLPAPVAKEFLGHVLSEYARWRNARRGTAGGIWRPLGPPAESVGATKYRRDVRYIHLNACRARLVTDPLAWPASTHRDATGLSLWPALPTAPDPVAFHGYVSGDPTVAIEGTLLPRRSLVAPTLEDVFAATSALGRLTADELARRSAGRTMLVRAARALTSSKATDIADFVGMSLRGVKASPRTADARIARIAEAAGDRRFSVLTEDPVPAWERYRQWRAALSE